MTKVFRNWIGQEILVGLALTAVTGLGPIAALTGQGCRAGLS